ncbi:hypothetical protein ABW20_dc0109818 [Dactylellina cionopaga]|nr:hypothetical protein ABW20_dc0109818 [Dactylellina cionopaga]
MAVLAIPPAAFDVVLRIARNVKNLFPGDNEEYWQQLEYLISGIEKACAPCKQVIPDNYRYYQSQHHLIQATTKALLKTLNGFIAIQKRYHNEGKSSVLNLALQARVWALFGYLDGLDTLQSTIATKLENRRRHELRISLLGIPKLNNGAEKGINDILTILRLLAQAVENMSNILQSVKKRMTAPPALASLGIVRPKRASNSGKEVITDVITEVRIEARETKTVINMIESYLDIR